MRSGFVRDAVLIVVGGIFLYGAQYVFDWVTATKPEVSWSALPRNEIASDSLKDEFQFSNDIQTLEFRNTGGAPAYDIEIVWSARPDFGSVPRELEWEWKQASNQNHVLVLGALQPDEEYMLVFQGRLIGEPLTVRHEGITLDAMNRLKPVGYGETVLSSFTVFIVTMALIASLLFNIATIASAGTKKPESSRSEE